jgi:hypothetical protein
MQRLITAAAALVAMSGAVAIAQTNNGANGTTKPQGAPAASQDQRLAPVGHRQPRLTSATADKDINKVDPEDAALDRKLKSICRGC